MKKKEEKKPFEEQDNNLSALSQEQFNNRIEFLQGNKYAIYTPKQVKFYKNAWNEHLIYRIDGVHQLPVLYGDNYELTKKIANIEATIMENKTFETAVVVDLKGNIVVDKRGQHTRVDFTSAELVKMKDCIVTHNHPLGWRYDKKDIRRIGNSFSIEDIKLAINGDVMEIRAVTPVYTFSMKRPVNGWGISAKEMNLIYDKEENNQYKEFLDRIRNGTLTDTQFEVVFFHTLWKKIAKDLGWEYRKMKTK